LLKNRSIHVLHQGGLAALQVMMRHRYVGHPQD
jgi:hypothetical protein